MCGAYAFFNLTFPPRKPLRKGYKTRPTISRARLSYRSVLDGERIPLRRYDRQGLGADLRDQSQLRLPSRSPAKQNEKRSRWTFAVLVFFLFACFALGGAIVGSAIIGYVAAGLFKAARYNMSTYVFLYNHFAGRSGPFLRILSTSGPLPDMCVFSVGGTWTAVPCYRGSEVWLTLLQPSVVFHPLLMVCFASPDGSLSLPLCCRRSWGFLREYRTLRLCVIFVSKLTSGSLWPTVIDII